MKRLFAICIALGALVCACQKTVAPDGEITAVGATTVGPEGGKLMLQLTSNCSWTISAPKGASVTPSNGVAGKYDVEVTLAPNNEPANMEYTIEVVFVNSEGTTANKNITLTVTAFIPDPVGELTVKGESKLASKGGDLTLQLVSDCVWAIAAPEGVTANPAAGAPGTHDIVVTLPANTTEEEVEYTIVAKLTNSAKKTIEKEVKLAVAAKLPDPKCTITSADEASLDFWGGEIKLNIEANCAWAITAPEGTLATPASGDAGIQEVVLSIPANEAKEKKAHKFIIKLTNLEGATLEKDYVCEVERPYLSYDGVDYKIVKLADGNVWMAENLRFVPAGYSAYDVIDPDSGFYCPIVEKDGKAAFSREESDIVANGLLYSTSVAFGTAVNADNAASLEGAQGICPEGWHIPTVAEQVGLVGKSSNAKLTDTNAPYYDAELSNGSIAKLNEDKANINAYGGVAFANATATKGTMFGVVSGKMNTGYFLSSSMYQATFDTDGSLKNIQFYGIMPNIKNGTVNVSYVGYRYAVSVRCVRNK